MGVDGGGGADGAEVSHGLTRGQSDLLHTLASLLKKRIHAHLLDEDGLPRAVPHGEDGGHDELDVVLKQLR